MEHSDCTMLAPDHCSVELSGSCGCWNHELAAVDAGEEVDEGAAAEAWVNTCRSRSLEVKVYALRLGCCTWGIGIDAYQGPVLPLVVVLLVGGLTMVVPDGGGLVSIAVPPGWFVGDPNIMGKGCR